MKTFLLILCFFLISTNAHAEDLKKLLNTCTKIENELLRLECYDNIIQQQITHTKSNSTNNTNWTVYSEISKLTDTTNIFIRTRALKAVKGKNESTYPEFVISCRDNVTTLYVDWYEYITTQDVIVTSRINKEKIIVETWSISTNHEAIFKKIPFSFIRQLFNKNLLLIQVIPDGENPRTAEFDISGLEDIIEPLQNACNWK